MSPYEFKTGLKEIKENLKGLTLQLINAHSAKPYTSLNEFGNAILHEEANGNSFMINQVWVNDSVVIVKSINQLQELLLNGNVSAVQFEAYYQPKDFSGYLRHGFTLND